MMTLVEAKAYHRHTNYLYDMIMHDEEDRDALTTYNKRVAVLAQAGFKPTRNIVTWEVEVAAVE